MSEFKLNTLVSKIVVDSKNPSKEASDIIRDCRWAKVVQKNWK